ncbi:hypothetical protein GC194_01400 [bacterium]|nr:hypothetical protein [bacterium]
MNRLSFLLLLAVLHGCTAHYRRDTVWPKEAIAIDKQVVDDSAAVATIAPYKEALDEQMNRVIAIAAAEFNNEAGPTGESSLGDFVSDLQLKESRRLYGQAVDMAVINHRGGLRVPILKGVVTVRNIFELMPFDNEIWLMELNGKEVQQLFDNAAQRKSNVIAGATYTIEGEKASQIIIGGAAFDPNRKYIISISDYLAGGGGGHDFLAGKAPLKDDDILCRNMIINYIENYTKQYGKPLEPYIDERVKMAE